MLQRFLNTLSPDQDSLLHELSREITDDMLAQIAMADYGQDREQYLASLLLLRNRGTFIQPMHRFPCEVLELVRNSEPDGYPEPERLRRHWMRAFACAALLRAIHEPWNYGGAGSPSFTLIQLLNSLEAVPSDFSPNAVRLLGWMMLHSDLDGADEQVIYYGVALLWLTLTRCTAAPDEALIELAEWIVRHEDEIHKRRPFAFDRWLLGIAHDPPPSPWEVFGARMAKLDLDGRAEQLKDWVKLIGSELAGNHPK